MVAACGKAVASIYAADEGADVGTLLDGLERDLMKAVELREEGDARDLSAKQAVQEGIEKLETFIRGKGMNVGLPSGFAFLDKMTSGFHPEQMIVVAGRPGTGGPPTRPCRRYRRRKPAGRSARHCGSSRSCSS